MPRIFDLTNYRETQGQNVPAGRYTVLVEDSVADTSKAGNDMAVLTLRVQHEDPDLNGSILIDRITFTEKAAFKVVDFLKAAGLFNGKRKYDIDKLIPAFAGRAVQVDVEDGEPYNGRVRSEVRQYHRVTSGAAAKAESADLSDLDEEVAGLSESTGESFEIPDTPEDLNLAELDLG